MRGMTGGVFEACRRLVMWQYSVAKTFAMSHCYAAMCLCEGWVESALVWLCASGKAKHACSVLLVNGRSGVKEACCRLDLSRMWTW